MDSRAVMGSHLHRLVVAVCTASPLESVYRPLFGLLWVKWLPR
jgi:hypothetical protein